MEKIVLRMRNKVIFKVWVAWLDTVQELIRQRSLLEKMTERMQSRNIFKVWMAWLDNVNELHRHKNDALRLMTCRFVAALDLKERLEKMRYATVLGSWQDQTAVERRLRVVCTKVEATVRQGCLYKAWATWCANAKVLRRQRNLLERMKLRMRSVFFHKAWASWDMHVQEVRRLQGLLQKMALQRYFQFHLIQYHDNDDMHSEVDSNSDCNSDSNSD